MPEYITIKEAAKFLRMSPRVIHKKCKKGLLPAKQLPGGKKWFINADELKKILS